MEAASEDVTSEEVPAFVVLDGPLDASWGDALIGVLDARRARDASACLELLGPVHYAQSRLVVETDELGAASPALVARLAVVFVPQSDAADCAGAVVDAWLEGVCREFHACDCAPLAEVYCALLKAVTAHCAAAVRFRRKVVQDGARLDAGDCAATAHFVALCDALIVAPLRPRPGQQKLRTALSRVLLLLLLRQKPQV